MLLSIPPSEAEAPTTRAERVNTYELRESQPAVPEQRPVFGPIKSTVPFKKIGRKKNGNGGQSTCWSEAQEVALFLFLFMLLLPGFPPVGAVVVVVVVNGASSSSWLAGGGGAVAAVLKSGSSPTSQSPAERSMGTFRDKQEAASNKQHAASRSSTATTTTTT